MHFVIKSKLAHTYVNFNQSFPLYVCAFHYVHIVRFAPTLFVYFSKNEQWFMCFMNYRDVYIQLLLSADFWLTSKLKFKCLIYGQLFHVLHLHVHVCYLVISSELSPTPFVWITDWRYLYYRGIRGSREGMGRNRPSWKKLNF